MYLSYIGNAGGCSWHSGQDAVSEGDLGAENSRGQIAGGGVLSTLLMPLDKGLSPGLVIGLAISLASGQHLAERELNTAAFFHPCRWTNGLIMLIGMVEAKMKGKGECSLGEVMIWARGVETVSVELDEEVANPGEGKELLLPILENEANTKER